MASSKRARRNTEIIAPEVRLIGADGEQQGVLPIAEALQFAVDAKLDLVEVSPQAEPPVCKVMDYGKYLFEQNKKAHFAKKKSRQTHLKEVKFRPNTDDGDFKIKLRNMIRFLEAGDKVKVTVRFRGREMVHQDIGRNVLERVKAALEDIAAVESWPKMEGRQLIMVIAPKKK